MLPMFRKKSKHPTEDEERGHHKLRVRTARGKQEMAWLENDRWQPQIDTVTVAEAESPMIRLALRVSCSCPNSRQLEASSFRAATRRTQPSQGDEVKEAVSK